MKLAKLLVVMMVLAMVFSLAACGGAATEAEPVQEAQETPSAAVSEDQVADEQAKANADYEQLTALLTDVVAHEDVIAEMTALRDQVIAGEATEAALLDYMKQLSDDSQRLLTAVQDAQWQTAYYDEHVALLTTTVEALAESELMSYEAGVNNDDSKFADIEALTTTYNESLDALLTLLGV
jgi:predicted house-cleaning NTP pyrophosphatase (Maf/HAM1 superfamily)